MADVRPFAAIRPRADLAPRIAALPYDVYSTEEAREVVEKNPDSFLRIDRAETNFEPGVSPYNTLVYVKAHDLLWSMVDEGKFIRDSSRQYYIYELTMNGRVQTGITALSSVDDYLNGVIKKHENTLEAKEEDRIRHVDMTNAQTGPIFLAYRASDAIRAVEGRVKMQAKSGKTRNEDPSSPLLYDFTKEDGVRHRVFAVDDPSDIDAITAAFAAMDSIYIADGHHRCASAVKVALKRREEHPGYTGDEEFNYFLSVLFPDDELRIFDYNRVVKDLNGLDGDEFLASIMFSCDVVPTLEFGGFRQQEAADPKEAIDAKHHEYLEQTIRPEKRHAFSVYVGGRWYKCTFLPEVLSSDPVKGLDVSILQDRILAPVLGIGDPKTDPRIDFIGGIRGLEAVEDRCEDGWAAGFAMYPTSMEELMAVADAGRLMPPKSTWFEPKLLSGLFIHELDR